MKEQKLRNISFVTGLPAFFKYCLFFLISLNAEAFCQTFVLDLYTPLGFSCDQTLVGKEDSLVLEKADSIKFKMIEEHFKCYPGIYCKGTFTDLENVIYYELIECDIPLGGSPWYCKIFYNTIIGDTYNFGGILQDFNKVFSANLSENCNPDFILNLINLYLNTLYPQCGYIILGSNDAVNPIYEYVKGIRNLKLLQFDLKVIENNFPELITTDIFHKFNGYYVFKFNTFRCDEKVERWVIYAFPDSLVIGERETVKYLFLDDYRNIDNIFDHLGIDEQEEYEKYKNEFWPADKDNKNEK